MTDIPCGKCGSMNIGKNGTTAAGAASGDRWDKTCPKLRKSFPAGYRKRAVIHTDYRESYGNILPPERHRAAGKESGETAHIGCFNNMLYQRCPGAVRETLSFSENEAMHGKRVRIFINSYNKILSVWKERLPILENIKTLFDRKISWDENKFSINILGLFWICQDAGYSNRRKLSFYSSFFPLHEWLSVIIILPYGNT